MAMLAYCSKHLPLWICGENVLMMLRAGMADDVVFTNFFRARSQFRELGYTIWWKTTCPSEDNVPETRGRLYYWGFFTAMNKRWHVHAEYHVASGIVDAVFKCESDKNSSDNNSDLFAVEDFALPDKEVSQRYAASSTCDPADEVKWPALHASWGADNLDVYPVTRGAYNIAPGVLAAAWPHVACLPDRELDMVRCFDRKLCSPSGSGLDRENRKVYLNCSQAINRNPATSASLGCITPGAKILALHSGFILHGSTLMRIQGIQSSLDYNLNYDILPEKGLACLAGNSCAGTSFGKALMASFAMSATMSSPTLFRMRRAGSDEEVERATAIESIAKRYKASSALGALLALADT